MPDCCCDLCIKSCRIVPGWFTPTEAKSALDAGHATELMADWYEDDNNAFSIDGRLYILCPAVRGYEGEEAPELDSFDTWFSSPRLGTCTFLNSTDRCEIHSTSYKPIQCRTSMSCQPNQMVSKEEVAKMWSNHKAQALIERWRVENNKT